MNSDCVLRRAPLLPITGANIKGVNMIICLLVASAITCASIFEFLEVLFKLCNALLTSALRPGPCFGAASSIDHGPIRVLEGTGK